LQFDLVHYPHPVLRKRSTEVTVFNDELRSFCERMFVSMEEHRGVGLAAPQVGVSKRIFITDHSRRKDDPPAPPERRIWINPHIAMPKGTTSYEEGCLSFPGIYAKVERHNQFIFHWQDEYGKSHQQSFDVEQGDFLGIVVQHELDHLDGRIFVEHLTAAQLTLIRKRLKDLEIEYKAATGKDGSVLRR
jgi:peptide deformylase